MKRCGLALALVLAACGAETDRPADSPLRAVLGGEPEPGFARALAPRPFEFPRDHGAHRDFQTEWWYFTGHLKTPGGRPFGYQVTFFRQGLRPGSPADDQRWASRELFMAHAALTDVGGRQFQFAERLERGRPGLAHAADDQLAVTVADWSATPGSGPDITLAAQDDGFALTLSVTLAGPVLRHGDGGLSAKSATPGNASYYYSMPRMPTRGVLRLGDETLAVAGTTWLDREWSTSVLDTGQVGWDWFSISLESDTDLMLFQLRDAAGRGNWFSGTLRQGGQVTSLSADDFTLTPGRRWNSPVTGAAYPVDWTVVIPRAGLELATRPVLDGQELNLAFRYWEGAIAVEGDQHGQPVRGRGYLEMTGYEGDPR